MAAAPAGVTVAWTGVERDPVTARIAGLLHPSAVIINERLQDAALAAHSMDAVIGNVPFGETPVYDPTAPKAVTKSLHNYCIWRSVRTLRPGGVAVLITSRYTMDARELRRARGDRGRGGPARSDPAARRRALPRRHRGRRPTSSCSAATTGGGPPAGDGPGSTRVLLAEAYPVQQWQLRRPRQPVVHRPPGHGARRVPARPAPRGTGGQSGSTGHADAGPVEHALADAAKGLLAGAAARGLAWIRQPQWSQRLATSASRSAPTAGRNCRST